MRLFYLIECNNKDIVTVFLSWHGNIAVQTNDFHGSLDVDWGKKKNVFIIGPKSF